MTERPKTSNKAFEPCPRVFLSSLFSYRSVWTCFANLRYLAIWLGRPTSSKFTFLYFLFEFLSFEWFALTSFLVVSWFLILAFLNFVALQLSFILLLLSNLPADHHQLWILTPSGSSFILLYTYSKGWSYLALNFDSSFFDSVLHLGPCFFILIIPNSTLNPNCPVPNP